MELQNIKNQSQTVNWMRNHLGSAINDLHTMARISFEHLIGKTVEVKYVHNGENCTVTGVFRLSIPLQDEANKMFKPGCIEIYHPHAMFSDRVEFDEIVDIQEV